MARRARRDGRRLGQVIVEVLLILPIFLMLVFHIMEIGHLAFRAILLHHAAYEVARVGSLTATTPLDPGCPKPELNKDKMEGIASRILPGSKVDAEMRETLTDPQEECRNYDVEVNITQPVPLVFLMTGFVLGTPPGSRVREMSAIVRMPVERPLFK